MALQHPLLRVKPIDLIMKQSDDPQQGLKRTLGPSALPYLASVPSPGHHLEPADLHRALHPGHTCLDRHRPLYPARGCFAVKEVA